MTKLPDLQFSVPCLEVENEEGKPPSLKYLFYELPLPEFPYGVSFYLVNGWCNSQGEFHQEIKILNPDKTELMATGKQEMTLRSPENPFMAVSFLQGLGIPAPGTYTVQVYVNDALKLEFPLPVREISDAERQRINQN